jgi:hypothetical protein
MANPAIGITNETVDSKPISSAPNQAVPNQNPQ